jgi:hypothetical protein
VRYLYDQRYFLLFNSMIMLIINTCLRRVLVSWKERDFLTPWFLKFDPNTMLVTRIPIWVHLPNLPLHL